MVTPINTKSTNRRAGFSLVEVAMSLAIVGFACVALIGMIPMGLTSFHQAMGNTIEADIVQNLSNDMLLANFSDLYQYSYQNSALKGGTANQTYYYDSEGTPWTASSQLPMVYTAVVTLTPITSSATASTSNSPMGLTVSSGNSGVSTGQRRRMTAPTLGQ